MPLNLLLQSSQSSGQPLDYGTRSPRRLALAGHECRSTVRISYALCDAEPMRVDGC